MKNLIQIGISKAEYSIDFNSGRIDTSAFPFNQWRKYAKDVLDETSRDLLLLGHPQGDIELRQEIASYFTHRVVSYVRHNKL